MTLASEFRNYTRELFLYQGEDLVIRPVVFGTVFFKQGAHPDVRKALLACFDKYVSLFGEHLKGGMSSVGSFSRKTAKGVAAMRKEIIENHDFDEVDITYGSATSTKMVREYEWAVLTALFREEAGTNHTGQFYEAYFDYGQLSHHKFMMPLEALFDAKQRKKLHEYLDFVCKTLPVWGGYAGLAPSQPFDRHSYQINEWALAKRFSGLTIESNWFLGEIYHTLSTKGEEPNKEFYPFELREGATVEEHGYIKSPNWINIIPDEFLNRIGGAEQVQKELEGDGVSFKRYKDERFGNILLIQSGELPSLGSPDESIPPHYLKQAQVLCPLLYDKPYDSLHTFHEGVEYADKINSFRWMRRFCIECEDDKFKKKDTN